MIYLDNAATTLKKPEAVSRALNRAMLTCGSPGRGGHAYAMRAAEVTFQCRERAAKLFSVDDPENVVFTFNATHGLNIAINSVVAAPGMRVLVTGYEHNSVIRPLTALGANIVPVGLGEFDPERITAEFRRELSRGAGAAVVNHVSNVFGYILPLEEIASLCREYGVPFVVDASQSAGCLPVSMKELGASFIAMPGHKGLYGPQGTGLLLCGGEATPILHGGSGSDSLLTVMPEHLPDRLEAGTHNTPGIAGLSQGVAFVLKKGEKAIFNREHALILLAAKGLKEMPNITVYDAHDKNHQAGVLSFNVVGMDAEETGRRFSDMGIALRAGYHCAPLAHKTVGTPEGGTVRVSVSDFTTKGEIEAFLNAAERIARGRKRPMN